MILGISGPSGSGKTTIARALRQLYAGHKSITSVQILHQDDFYKPGKDVPMICTRAGRVVNWDCPEAVDMQSLAETLRAYRAHGTFPESVRDDLLKRSKEDLNDTSETGVSEALMMRLRQDGALPVIHGDLLILDGFMLYQAPEILENLDLAVLLRGSFATLKNRREARSGYVTLEGFWKDPEHYFEDCVWPEYVKSHAQFFENHAVQGTPLSHNQIVISKNLDLDLDKSLQFVIEAISGTGM